MNEDLPCGCAIMCKTCSNELARHGLATPFDHPEMDDLPSAGRIEGIAWAAGTIFVFFVIPLLIMLSR